MNTLSLNTNTIDRFFGFMYNLDTSSKKRLIIKLTESIQSEKANTIDLKSLYGTWDDNREADDIIKEILQSRIDNKTIEEM